jgi:hypothetical protein
VETDIQKAEQAGQGRIMRWVTARYEAAIHWSLRHYRIVLMGAAGVLAGAVVLNSISAADFFPIPVRSGRLAPAARPAAQPAARPRSASVCTLVAPFPPAAAIEPL